MVNGPLLVSTRTRYVSGLRMGVAEGPGITRGADCCAGARGSAEQPANVARLIASSTRVVNQQLAISPYVDSAYTEARAVHAERGESTRRQSIVR
jgi:hypothetical protein